MRLQRSSHTYMHLATTLHTVQGEYEKGISQLKEALKYAQTMGTKHHEAPAKRDQRSVAQLVPSQATILGNIGAGYQRMGNFEEVLCSDTVGVYTAPESLCA